MEDTKIMRKYLNIWAGVPFVVNVKEIRVEGGLDDPSQDHNGLRAALEHHTPDPIQQVKSTISPKCHQVMRRDGLSLPSLLQQEHLGQDGHGLQEDGKSPEDLPDVQGSAGTGTGIFKVPPKQQARDDQIIKFDSVQFGTVSGTETEPGKVEDGCLATQE